MIVQGKGLGQLEVIIRSLTLSLLVALTKFNLPGHGILLHALDSLLAPSPVQSFPSCCGAGLSHFRSRNCVPPPQVTEHDPKSPQVPYFPLTKEKKSIKIMFKDLEENI